MSTKGTIAGVETPEMYVHIYTECFYAPPAWVCLEVWEQGDTDNHSMTVSMPQDKALQLADDMTRWATGIREWMAKQAAKVKP